MSDWTFLNVAKFGGAFQIGARKIRFLSLSEIELKSDASLKIVQILIDNKSTKIKIWSNQDTYKNWDCGWDYFQIDEGELRAECVIKNKQRLNDRDYGDYLGKNHVFR